MFFIESHPLVGPYDFYSIMHYRLTDASANGQPTMVPKDLGVDKAKVGNQQSLSEQDVNKVELMYGKV